MPDQVSPFQTRVTREGYRSAHASESLTPGTIISSEAPFATVLLRSVSSRYCASCLIACTDVLDGRLKKCSGGCNFTFYCSRACQLQDFEIHKHTCRHYSNIVCRATQVYANLSGITHGLEKDLIMNTFPLEEFILGRKVYLKLCLDANVSVKEIQIIPFPESMQGLTAFFSASENDCMAEDALAQTLADSLKLDSQYAYQFFKILLAKFRCNNFGIQNILQEVIAHGVFPEGAILNHSCEPNAILIYDGKKQIIRTIKNVEECEELVHSYTDVCKPTSVRQQHLLRTYGFLCNCERCQGLGVWKNVDEELMKTNGMTEEDESKVQELIGKAQTLSVENIEDSVEVIQREYAYLSDALTIQRSKLGTYNLERYKTECLALSTAILMHGNDNVLVHAQAAVDFLKFTCNPYHPLLLLQQMTLAELYEGFGYQIKSKSLFKALVESCRVAYGEEHLYYQLFRSKISAV